LKSNKLVLKYFNHLNVVFFCSSNEHFSLVIFLLISSTQMTVSSWRTSQTTDYKKMYDAIVESLHKIEELCQVSKLWWMDVEWDSTSGYPYNNDL